MGVKTEDQLYSYVRGRLSDKGRTYVFIDEPRESRAGRMRSMR